LPGLMIVITAVSLNLLGDSVRDALDPKARLRGAF
jgi:peptide/nickel transport system permease protein